VSAALEQRYRSALRWYPAAWRSENADAVVGTLLDVADGDNRVRPRRGELANLAANGLLARFAWVDRLYPSAVRDRAASLALGFGFSVAVITLVFYEWAPWSHDGPIEQFFEPGFGPFASTGAVLSFIWIAAGLAALLRLGAVAKWLLVASLGFSAWFAFGFEQTTMFQRPDALEVVVLGLIALVALTGKLTNHPAHLGSGVLAMSAWYFWVLSEHIDFGERLNPGAIWMPLAGNGAHFYLTVAGLAAVAFVIAKRPIEAKAIVVASLPIAVAAWFAYVKAQDLQIGLELFVKIAVVIGLLITVRTGIRARRRRELSR